MEDLPGFGRKNNLTLSNLANKVSICSKDEKDERMYIYNDEYTCYFV